MQRYKIPAIVVSGIILSNPYVRAKIKETFSGVTNRFFTKGD